MSNRKIAKLTGVSDMTVGRDLAATNVAKSATDVAPPIAAIALGQFETIVIDPPWPMTKIERDARQNQAGFSYPTMDEHEAMAAESSAKTAADAATIVAKSAPNGPHVQKDGTAVPKP